MTDDGRDALHPEVYRVLRQGGTEAPFSSPLNAEARPGQYRCAGCSAVLFASSSKFNAGCGWPSFDRPAEAEGLRTLDDDSFGLRRIEVRCRHCDGHLGHVFDDGPTETGQRYCINGVAMTFEPAERR